MYIIDTHAHLYGDEFTEDIDLVLERARQNGVGKIFLPNIDKASISALNALAERNPGFLYPMMGLHPTDLDQDYQQVLRYMETLVATPGHPYIGIGEVGLDYYWDKTYYQEQQTAFEIQVEWAVERGLPLMIHTRSAQKELVDILKRYDSAGIRGVFHCFGGSVADAEELLQFERFALGINGLVTFKKATLPEVLRGNVPLERLVLETDAPYLAYTLKKIAEIYEVSEQTVALTTTETASRIFHFEE